MPGKSSSNQDHLR